MKKGKGIAILCIVLACILGLGYYASIILSSTGRGENQNITLGLDLAVFLYYIPVPVNIKCI